MPFVATAEDLTRHFLTGRTEQTENEHSAFLRFMRSFAAILK